MDDPTADPFTRAFTKLWDVLIADADWAAAVEPGNRPKGDTEGAARRAIHRVPGDFDEVFIVPAPGGTFPLKGTSSGYQWTQGFQIQMSTRSTGFVERLFPLKFKTLRALERGRQQFPLPWLDDLILDVQPTADVSETNVPTDPNRQTSNWVGVIGIALRLNIPKTLF